MHELRAYDSEHVLIREPTRMVIRSNAVQPEYIQPLLAAYRGTEPVDVEFLDGVRARVLVLDFKIDATTRFAASDWTFTLEVV